MPDTYEVICVDRSRCAYDVMLVTDHIAIAYKHLQSLVFHGMMQYYSQIMIVKKAYHTRIGCPTGIVQWLQEDPADVI